MAGARSDLAARFKVRGFPVFGVDGSRPELPRAESDEGRLSPAKTRRPARPKAKARSRRRARSQASRDHPRQMIAAPPAGALITADAGFVGYETWAAILDGGRHLLTRVGADVRRLRRLGHKAVVDPYKRANKGSRDYPRKKREQAAGAPEVRDATKAQINAAKEIRDQRESRLTAWRGTRFQ